MTGSATFEGGSYIQSGSNGQASVQVVLGNIAGQIKIEARSPLLEGSPIPFTVYAEPLRAVQISILSGNNQVGTVGQPLVDSLSVWIRDEYGNSVSGSPVYFYKSNNCSGGFVDNTGATKDNLTVISDSRGLAVTQFRCGQVVETALLKARSGSTEKLFNNISVVNNPHFPVWVNKNNIQNTYTVSEGSQLMFTLMTAPDGDGDELRFEIGNLVPPAGAEIVSAAVAYSWIFRWTPGFDQGRPQPYDIFIRVVDGKGGWDGKNMRVNVQDANRLPTIISTIPKSDTTVFAGQTVTFWVNAQDADGDPLHYSWLVDNAPVVNDNAVFFHLIDKSFIGNRIVKVFVSDQSGFSDPDKGSHRWELTVTTSVELSMFAARFETGNGTVRVTWSTVRETDNAGFEVYRSHSADGEFEKVSENVIPSQTEGEYCFIDKDVQLGRTYYYKLVAKDIRGNSREYGPVMVKIPLPEEYVLYQNYPNPFNPVTKIRYEIPKRERVNLTIYNVMGQKVATLVDEEKTPGYYVAEWNGKDEYGRDASTGVYIYRLVTDSRTLTCRMVKLQ